MDDRHGATSMCNDHAEEEEMHSAEKEPNEQDTMQRRRMTRRCMNHKQPYLETHRASHKLSTVPIHGKSNALSFGRVKTHLMARVMSGSCLLYTSPSPRD